jgi:hypothetical protein
MGTIAGSVLITQARGFLQDVSSAIERWTDAELLGYLNDGQVELVNLKHDAHTLTELFTCANDARQTLPAAGIAFISVSRNMGGAPVTEVDRGMMDRAVPGWTLEIGTTVMHYMRDDRDELGFYVYPVCDGAAIELTYTPIPEPLATDAALVAVGDNYAPALVDYIVYRALSSDLDNPRNIEVAGNWMAMFQGKVTGKNNAEGRVGHNG